MAIPRPKPFTFRATVLVVHDADTLTVDIDLGFDLWKRNASVRLFGCNAIELADPGGAEAQVFLAALLPPGTPWCW